MSDNLSATAALDAIERRRYALRASYAVLEFAETTDPPEAAPHRAVALGELEALDQELLCGEELGRALEGLAATDEPLRRAQVRVLERDRAGRLSVPASLLGQRAELVGRANAAWKEARDARDWALFAPLMAELLELSVAVARAADGERDPFDYWLDQAEPGSSRASYDALFAETVPTIERLCARQRELGEAAPMDLGGPFDIEEQYRLFDDVASFEGIDAGRLELSRTIHPFTSSVDSHHVMIANHADPDDVLSGLYAALHEGGHALYECSVDAALDLTCLSGGASAGLHEASSRFFENYVGRDRALMPSLLALLGARFGEVLAPVGPDGLYDAANRVRFTPSRMDSDELTYPLHILVRYEVERALFSGEASVAEVPALWAELYERHLGVRPEDDLAGALQDVHWSMGLVGYFPTYALGGVIGAQLKDAMVAQGVPFGEALAAGDLSAIRDWMAAKVWRYGRALDTADILERATGSALTTDAFCAYLEAKFG